jgi:Actin like proteins N terminal domain
MSQKRREQIFALRLWAKTKGKMNMNTNLDVNTSMIFGADLGMGAIKLFGPHGGLQVLSQVSIANTQKVQGMLGLSSKKAPLHIKTSQGSFYIGEGAHDWGRPVENLDYDRLTGAPEMNALFYAALTRYMQEHGPVTNIAAIMVGLPLETMTGDAAQANADAVRKWLKGAHTWEADEVAYTVTIEDAKCTSQPAAAFFDHILDDGGKLIPARKIFASAEVGIISIGFNTIELLVVRDKAPVQRFTAGNTIGVRRLIELINTEKSYSRGELDVLLRNGKLDMCEALPIWSREVFGQIESQWGRMFRRFAGVIVVGGGSILLRDALTAKFTGKAIFPDDLVLSIARGLYKFALTRQPKISITVSPVVTPITTEACEQTPTVQPALLNEQTIAEPLHHRNGVFA